ncbi:MBL fold metallo-hydrolase [Oryzifoliimicrobium ureilyticus]|uniref:MBL fold metallo-hydrolase n=1 Tax=Oryzifoliimicrobium ureilyticus TaxID=3113724 RepID=UPI003075F742
MPQSELYRFRHGEFDITVLSDGPIILHGELFAPEADEAERANIVSRLKGYDNKAHAQSNIPLIVHNKDIILVDVGAGKRFQPTEGMLEENLGRVGLSADDITIVLISHAHPDHIWGLLKDDGSLRFSKAKYFVGKAEWAFWMGEAASALPPEVQPFVAGARRDLSALKDEANFLEDGDQIVAGMHVLATPGHTPGHLSVVLDGDVPLIITVDAVSSDIVSFEHPEWSFGFDMDPAEARVTRRSLMDRAVAQNAKLLGFHWTYPGVGWIKQVGAAYEFVSAAGERP